MSHYSGKSVFTTSLLMFSRTPSKQKSPQEEKDIDIVELLRNVDPKEYEKYARMYGITDYRGLLQAIEQLKKEKAEESGRPVRISIMHNLFTYFIKYTVWICKLNQMVYIDGLLRCSGLLIVHILQHGMAVFVCIRKLSEETESLMRTWLSWWLTCRRGWNAPRCLISLLDIPYSPLII